MFFLSRCGKNATFLTQMYFTLSRARLVQKIWYFDQSLVFFPFFLQLDFLSLNSISFLFINVSSSLDSFKYLPFFSTPIHIFVKFIIVCGGTFDNMQLIKREWYVWKRSIIQGENSEAWEFLGWSILCPSLPSISALKSFFFSGKPCHVALPV